MAESKPVSVLDRWLLIPPPSLAPVHLPFIQRLKPTLMAPFRAEDRKTKPDAVNNIVLRVETQSPLDFLPMFGALSGVHRKRVKFPQAVIRFGNVSTDRWETLIVYTSGRYVMCGMRNEMTAIRTLQQFRIEMHQCGIPVGLSSVILVNVVVNAVMPFHVDIVAANDSRQLPESSLTQDDFPGMTFKMRRVQVLAFANGRCVLTGSADFFEMDLVRTMVQQALQPFSLPMPEAPPRRRAGTQRAGVKNGKRLQKGIRLNQKKEAGKARAAGDADKKAPVRRTRKSRVAPALASALVEPGQSRVAGRSRGVAFKLTEKLVIRPGESLGV